MQEQGQFVAPTISRVLGRTYNLVINPESSGICQLIDILKINKPGVIPSLSVLPGYHKKTNHIILPVLIQYVDNKQKLRDRKFTRTNFLKRQIYGYFYNNLRIDKSEKLTRKELNEYYRNERIHRSNEYQKLMQENGWSKADLARYLGVSRAWVTIVMRELE